MTNRNMFKNFFWEITNKCESKLHEWIIVWSQTTWMDHCMVPNYMNGSLYGPKLHEWIIVWSQTTWMNHCMVPNYMNKSLYGPKLHEWIIVWSQTTWMDHCMVPNYMNGSLYGPKLHEWIIVWSQTNFIVLLAIWNRRKSPWIEIVCEFRYFNFFSVTEVFYKNCILMIIKWSCRNFSFFIQLQITH
jgi:hypothetical protein